MAKLRRFGNSNGHPTEQVAKQPFPYKFIFDSSFDSLHISAFASAFFFLLSFGYLLSYFFFLILILILIRSNK
jgi:hypothetical protein